MLCISKSMFVRIVVPRRGYSYFTGYMIWIIRLYLVSLYVHGVSRAATLQLKISASGSVLKMA